MIENKILNGDSFLIGDKKPVALADEVVFLRRVTFGLAPESHYSEGDRGDLALFRSGGNTTKERVEKWVNNQLTGVTPKTVRADIKHRIDRNAYETIDLTLQELYKDYYMVTNKRSRPIAEFEILSFLRSVYSRYQLYERLSMFWFDHFNVDSSENELGRSIWGHWDETIRSGMTGNFYKLLLSTAEHGAMNFYLNNNLNEKGSSNENYARELFELHSFGAINYYGLIRVDQIEKNPNNSSIPPEWRGNPKGYVDGDVYEACRMLAGWHIANAYGEKPGAFYFNESKADYDPVTVFGHNYSVNGDNQQYLRFVKEEEGNVNFTGKRIRQLQTRHMIWKCATHPGTARHIALKLVRHFYSDSPPEALVQAVTKTFLDNFKADNQLELCYKTLFNHPLMREPATWGQKKARPAEMLVHACRSMGCQRNFRPRTKQEIRDGNGQFLDVDACKKMYEARQSVYFLTYRIQLTGHRRFHWGPPDGQPDDAGHWLSTNSLVNTWNRISVMAECESVEFHKAGLNSPVPFMRIYPLTISKVAELTPKNIVEFWAERVWGFKPDNTELLPFLNIFCASASYFGTIEYWSLTDPIPVEDFLFGEGFTNPNMRPHAWGYKLRSLVTSFMTHPYAMIR